MIQWVKDMYLGRAYIETVNELREKKWELKEVEEEIIQGHVELSNLNRGFFGSYDKSKLESPFDVENFDDNRHYLVADILSVKYELDKLYNKKYAIISIIKDLEERLLS